MKLKPHKEGDILKACLGLLEAVGAFAFRMNSGSVVGEYKGKTRYVKFSSAKGMSDILGILPDGRMIACETKVPGNKATPDQRQFLTEVGQRGGLAVVVDSVDDLAAVLREEGFSV